MAPLIAIVGPTASGKSALALELAKRFDGEIICADSRSVYIGMDIGTAKPSGKEQELVRHHLLDVVKPDEPFTVADFKRLADAAITDIINRGKLPILVGGSGLYIDAVLFDYQFSGASALRDKQNPRHLDKAVPRQHRGLKPNTLVLGMQVEREVLNNRIATRIKRMLEEGLIDEVKSLKRHYPDSKALLAPGYKAFSEYIDGAAKLDEATAEFIRNDVQLAKRQRTWFKRNHSIQWIDDPRKAVDIATTFLLKS